MGAWGVGMRANDTALDAVCWFEKYDDDGKRSLTRRGKLVKDGKVLLEALKWVEKQMMKGRFAYRSSSDESILGVADFFMERGISPKEAEHFILRSIERELHPGRLSSWCDQGERRDALLRFKARVEGKPVDEELVAQDNEGLMSKMCRKLSGEPEAKDGPSSIQLKTLEEILQRETSCIAEEDVPNLMRVVRKEAAKHSSKA